MMNPLQVTLTHAEQAHPASGGYSGALARVVLSLRAACEHSGLVPRGRVRVSVVPRSERTRTAPGPGLYGVLVAGGPDLPDPEPDLDDAPAKPTC